MEKVDTLVVDKTGTLTQGKPAVHAHRDGGSLFRRRSLAACRSIERASEHPLALAIVAAAEAKNIATSP